MIKLRFRTYLYIVLKVKLIHSSINHQSSINLPFNLPSYFAYMWRHIDNLDTFIFASRQLSAAVSIVIYGLFVRYSLNERIKMLHLSISAFSAKASKTNTAYEERSRNGCSWVQDSHLVEFHVGLKPITQWKISIEIRSSNKK